MRKVRYQEAISKIKATDSFKANTILKMQNELKKDNQNVVLQKHKFRYKSIGVVAACCAVVLSIGILLNRQPNSVNGKIFNPITINNEQVNKGNAGIFEGYLAYRIEELEDGNPWTPDSKLTSMPVFENTSQAYLTGDEMIKRAKEVADKMSLNIKKVYTQPTQEDIEAQEKKTGKKVDTTPTYGIAICDGVSIAVDSSGDTTIHYKPSLSIPDKYSFTYNETNHSQAKDTLLYLINNYSHVINMKSPALKLFSHYNYEGKPIVSYYTAYESDGDLLNKILGYNFKKVSFYPDYNGKLSRIYISKTDLPKVIGSYPIITADEARKLLLDKHYITTVHEDLPDEKYIAKVELLYLYFDKVFMPYYEFLVEMPTMQQKDGLKTFGAFYVPAVKSEYLTYMPVWKGVSK